MTNVTIRVYHFMYEFETVWASHHATVPQIIIIRGYCELWAVSRKRIGKQVVAERLILGSQLVTQHVFHGYEN
jgi:hypothetical protein